ncbi:MAG: DUF4214 domain-containing protein [Candidatus Andersenbacteria bacterium]
MRFRRLDFELLEKRQLLSLTVLTHGFQLLGDFPTWVYDMAEAIESRLPSSERCTRLQIEEARYQPGDSPDATGCNHYLLVDWAERSAEGGSAARQEAEAALLSRLAARLEEADEPLDVHFIGHSRGTVVNSEVVRGLLLLHATPRFRDKIGFVHVTMLDPVTLSSSNDPLPFSTFDTSQIVDWADNYYQTTGESLPGQRIDNSTVRNIALTEVLRAWDERDNSIFEDGDHSEVHDWYHWTIDQTDDQQPALSDPKTPVLTSSDRALLYTAANGIDSDRDGITDTWGFDTVPNERRLSPTVAYNGHYYRLIVQPTTWTAAESTATVLGGHVVTVNDVAENEFVAELIRSVFGSNELAWIGLSDVASEGTFVWSSEEEADYRNFAAGEPNDAGAREDYVLTNWVAKPPFNFFPAGSWNDHPNFSRDANGQQGSIFAVLEFSTSSSTLVQKLYRDILERDPDVGGWLYWTQQIDRGQARLGDVAAGIFESNERLDPLIQEMYHTYLFREADAAGLAFWRDQIWKRDGGPDNVIAGIISSPEFFQAAGSTPRGWVTELYRRLLGREPDLTGLNYWTQRLTGGQATRPHIVLGFLRSEENFQALVRSWYQQYLHRSPGSTEVDFFVQKLHRGASPRAIQMELIDSQEYRFVPSLPMASLI